MHNLALMAIVDGRQDLRDNFGRVILAERLLFSDLVKQLAAVAKPANNEQKELISMVGFMICLLCHKEVALLILEKLVEFQYVWMIELL